MVFSTLYFIYLFLPLCLGLYFLLRDIRLKNLLLLVLSLFFYSWGEPVWIILLLLSATVDFLHGQIIGRFRGHWLSKAAVVSCLIINLSLLGFFKYSGFIVENFNSLLGVHFPVPSFALPIGISFYTFQTISYVIDVYRDKVPVQHSIIDFMLFVSLFPQLVAGPIIRYSDVAAQIRERTVTTEGFSRGITRFITGLSKKVLIANTAGSIASSILISDKLGQLSVAEAWLGMLLFAFQIYFDFSGYSDMAIGMGKMFGFDYIENFNYPYISKSVTDFWRRWHISLSTFFRDYLYIPLGGNRRFQVRNLLIVWFLTGLWHGPSWNFVFWGLFYFVFLVLEKTFLLKLLERIPAFFGHIYALLVILVGWVFFYFINMKDVLKMLNVMFFMSGQPLTTAKDMLLITNNAVLFMAAIAACMPIAPKIKSFFEKLSASGENGAFGTFCATAVFNETLLLVSTAVLVGSSYNPFLYFRF